MKNKVFIACSLDGFIADINGGIEWLNSVPNPDQNDMGYQNFTSQIDALVMGRTTFETICGFDMEWPYKKPVFVLSNTLTEIPNEFADKAQLMNGSLKNIIEAIHQKGYFQIYIDGGKTIQSFLKEDLIDEITITTIPILLGGGISLFGDLSVPLKFECKESKIFLEKVVQSRFIRDRK